MMEGKVAVVTGAGSGLGEAIARQCAKAGARVLLADVDGVRVQAVRDALLSDGAQAVSSTTNVADARAMENLAALCRDQFGGCDYLFNNAGIALYKPLAQCSPGEWQDIFSVNVLGVANGISAFVPHMVEAGTGHVVNVASMAGLVPLAGFGIYTASKQAVVGLSEVLAAELADSGVAVTILCPGWIATNIQPDDEAETPAFAPELSRVITADEAARLLLEAVSQRRLYATTHAEWKLVFEARAKAIARAFDHAGSVPGKERQDAER